jgi:putative ABC transport system substrate-binding protein
MNVKTTLLFVLLLVFTSLSPPLPASEKITISIIKTSDDTPYEQAIEGFKKYFEENDISLWTSETNLAKENVEQACIKVEKAKPDMIVALGTNATVVVNEKIKDIPIVFSMILYEKFVPESNLSGCLMDIPFEFNHKYLKKIVPRGTRVGMIYKDVSEKYVEEIRAYADKSGLEIVSKKISSIKDLESCFDDMSGRVDAFYILPEPELYIPDSIKHVILQCLKKKIALVGLSSAYTRAGALYSLTCDYEDIGRQTGEIVMKAIKNKTYHAVVFPRKAKLSINLHTARQISIKIPEDILNGDTEVFGK